MSSTIHRLGGTTMGTTWSVLVVAAAGADLRRLHFVVQRELDTVVAEMSNWQADSSISRFNRASAGSAHRLPEGFCRVLRAAQQIAEASDGAFDPTLGALVDGWGFGPSRTLNTAMVDELDRLRAASGWHRLQWQDDVHIVQPGGLQLDLCGIAKGHAVDAVTACLRHSGIGAALVEVGGELQGYGRKPDGDAWRVIVEGWQGDEDDAQPARIVELDDLAVATSGDRWHHRERNARRESHTLDPRTGRPLADAPTAVTVLMQSAMQADGWATALGVLGCEAGFELACARGIAARFIDNAARDYRERMTPAFQGRLLA